MKILSFCFALVLFGTTACQQTSVDNKSATTTQNTNVTRTGDSSANTTDAPAVKTYQGTGVVTEVRPQTGEIELKHEEIKGLMPAMQMMFHVKNKADLQNLKVGDQVDFTLEDRAGAEIMSEIRKR